MSNAVEAIKDFNPKVVGEALNCVEILILHHKHDFLPLSNMTFDLLLEKLNDFKVSFLCGYQSFTLNFIVKCKHRSITRNVLQLTLTFTNRLVSVSAVSRCFWS